MDLTKLNPNNEEGLYRKQPDGSTIFVPFSALPEPKTDSVEAILPDGVENEPPEPAPRHEFNKDRVKVTNTKVKPYYWLVYLDCYFQMYDGEDYIHSVVHSGTGLLLANARL